MAVQKNWRFLKSINFFFKVKKTPKLYTHCSPCRWYSVVRPDGMWHYHSLTSLQSPGHTAFHLESFILWEEKIQFKSCNRLSFQRKKSCLCPDGRKGFTLTLHLPVDALWEINTEHKEEWFVLKKSLSSQLWWYTLWSLGDNSAKLSLSCICAVSL